MIALSHHHHSTLINLREEASGFRKGPGGEVTPYQREAKRFAPSFVNEAPRPQKTTRRWQRVSLPPTPLLITTIQKRGLHAVDSLLVPLPFTHLARWALYSRAKWSFWW